MVFTVNRIIGKENDKFNLGGVVERSEIFRLGKIKKYDAENGKAMALDRSRRKKTDCEDSIEVVVSSPESELLSLRFSHKGCLLSRASMNALMESIQEKTRDEARRILIEYRKMIGGFSHSNLPERLLLFKKFVRFPSRVPCLLLGCEKILKTIGEN